MKHCQGQLIICHCFSNEMLDIWVWIRLGFSSDTNIFCCGKHITQYVSHSSEEHFKQHYIKCYMCEGEHVCVLWVFWLIAYLLSIWSDTWQQTVVGTIVTKEQYCSTSTCLKLFRKILTINYVLWKICTIIRFTVGTNCLILVWTYDSGIHCAQYQVYISLKMSKVTFCNMAKISTVY